MVMRSTRLEFLIVTIGFVILLLCSRPPRSGNAEPPQPESPVAAPETSTPVPAPVPEEPAVKIAAPSPSAQTPDVPVRVPEPKPAPAPQPATKRMASVDARHCPGLNFPEIMYGEVTVRWVWDGSKFVPRKVCVVNAPNGVTTVWSFDHPGGAILTEIGEAPADGQ